MNGCRFLSNSDAHYLWDIHEAEEFITLDPTDDGISSLRAAFFEALKRHDKENDA